MGALLSLFHLVGFLSRGAAALRRLDNVGSTATTPTPSPTTSSAWGGLGSLLRWFSGAQPKPPPPTCVICMDPVPATTSSKVGDTLTSSDVATTLTCGHTFCNGCIGSYAAMKVRERKVEWDQLVCPVVECKRAQTKSDLRAILPTEMFDQYTQTLQRIRDEKNPRARWCPRPECGELIVCEPDQDRFTCPKCATTGCFYCRGASHWLAFLCKFRADTTTIGGDASFARWASSVDDGERTVRACPNCRIHIWRSGGCNHMTCTHCRHEYCWVCDAEWERSHYACRQGTRSEKPTTTLFDIALLACAIATLFPLLSRAWYVTVFVLSVLTMLVQLGSSMLLLLARTAVALVNSLL